MNQQHFTVTQTTFNNTLFFGVEITDTNGCVYAYKYISENEAAVKRLVEQMSKEYISPAHFADIISDFIIGESLSKIEMCNS